MKNDKVSSDSKLDRPAEDGVKNDVVGLFSWANLESSKYRDYSESRDKSRAVARERSEMERSREQQAATPLATAGEGGETGSRRGTYLVRTAAERKLTTMPGAGRTAAQPTQRNLEQRESSRWAAFKGPLTPEDRSYEDDLLKDRLPTLAFFSLAGGTGKTSVAAAMGGLLAADGTGSLLVDTHVYGLLPLFFGARELPAGTSRTFAGTNGAPLRILALDTSIHDTEHPTVDQIAHHADGMDRILIDVSTGSIELLRKVLPLLPKVIVVLAPDMASVVSLQSVQKAIAEMEEECGTGIQAFYLLNQFDVSLRLHRDVRERLMRQLGRRLLPFAVRRGNAVAEALAAGMTIVDYASDSETVEDLRSLSQWIRELNEPRLGEMQDVRRRQR